MLRGKPHRALLCVGGNWLSDDESFSSDIMACEGMYVHPQHLLLSLHLHNTNKVVSSELPELILLIRFARLDDPQSHLEGFSCYQVLVIKAIKQLHKINHCNTAVGLRLLLSG